MATELEELQEKFVLSKREAHGWWTRAFVAEERLIWAYGELARARDLLQNANAEMEAHDPDCDDCCRVIDESRKFLSEVTNGPSNIPPQRSDSGSSPDEGEALPPGA